MDQIIKIESYNKNKYLIKSIVETFVETFKVQQNHASACLHANFDTVDVAADLKGS